MGEIKSYFYADGKVSVLIETLRGRSDQEMIDIERMI